jgi:hypothetical protein
VLAYELVDGVELPGQQACPGVGSYQEARRRLELPVETVPQETYGPLGPIFATNQPSSSTHTHEALGWEPTHPSLLEDLENIQP